MLNGATRLPQYEYNYLNAPNSHLDAPIKAQSSSRVADITAPTYHKQESQALSMPDSESSQQRSTGRSEEHWKNFYKNGLPKEIIVIEDSPSPQIPNSVEPEPIQQHPMTSNGSGSRQPAKKRKREDVYDPVYHVEPGPGARPSYKYEDSGSTISTDRTTSAQQTTAATSLGSNYSGSGSRPYAADDVQPGQKRKRVATRQQLAAEAKRRENEANGDAFLSYHPPPKPPIKASEVQVKVLQDVSSPGKTFCETFANKS